jgi:hypothetical protein
MQKQESLKDKDGYLLIEKEFTYRGYDFKLVKDFKDGWFIYEKSKKNQKHNKYELVKPKKQDAFVFNGKKIEDKWVYPNDNAFGKTGFDCVSLQVAEARHLSIIQNKEDQEEKEALKNEEVRVPTRSFTIKDFMKANPKLSYSLAYVKIKELIDSQEIRLEGTKKAKRGKASNVYIKR